MITATSRILESNKELILSLYSSGVSANDISKRFECYPQMITSRLLKWLNKKSLRPDQGNVRYFQNIDTPIKAYFVGFIAADGCIQKIGAKSLSLSITLHNKDRSILEKLKEEIGCEHELMYIASRDHIRFVLTNEFLAEDLKALDITERKSLTMSNFLLKIPKQFRKAAILGYFDGDGCIYVRYHQNKYRKQSVQIRATKELCEGIMDELDISIYHISFRDSIPNLAISSIKGVLEFFKLYQECDFYLQRKYEKFLPLLRQDQTISSSTALPV